MGARVSPPTAAGHADERIRRDAVRKRSIYVAVAAALAILGAAVVSPAVAGQEASGDAEVRIVARKLDSGRIEFGLQQRQTDDTWGDRQLPRVRFFPTTAQVDRWLASSALELTVGEVRIVALKLDSGRIEFGLQQRQTDDTWGDRQLPRVRFFPTTARFNRWLASSPLTLVAPQSAARVAAVVSGGAHSCALEADGTVNCWGANRFGQADAPDGHHTGLAGGVGHSCALRTDRTVTCWGWNEHRQTDAPDGGYTAITAGWGHSCALRTNGIITCWGNNTSGQTDAPNGQYTAIAAGVGHSCALGTDRTITCWGNNDLEQTDAPDGQYTAIAAGGGHSCALGTDRTITCWGNNASGQTDAPDGQHSAVAAGGGHSCALGTDRTITCWGNNRFGQADDPTGQYSAVTAGWGHSCALDASGTITCWGDLNDPDAPS